VVDSVVLRYPKAVTHFSPGCYEDRPYQVRMRPCLGDATMTRGYKMLNHSRPDHSPEFPWPFQANCRCCLFFRAIPSGCRWHVRPVIHAWSLVSPGTLFLAFQATSLPNTFIAGDWIKGLDHDAHGLSQVRMNYCDAFQPVNHRWACIPGAHFPYHFPVKLPCSCLFDLSG
jgi:hypothetical protein